MDSIEVRFGKRVRILRKRMKLSQLDFSFKCGLHRNYICDLELGRRNVSLEAIEKIAKGLNVKIEDLFKEEI